MQSVILSFCLLASLGTTHAAQAQASQAIVTGVHMLLGTRRGLAAANAEKPVVTTTTYQARTYPMQRTPPAGLGILGGDQIAYLERQLTACHGSLLADSTHRVCTSAQLAQLEATQAAILRVQPKWPMQPYAQEISFYVAEDARRQQAATATPAK